jgi:hypothetical protein
MQQPDDDLNDSWFDRPERELRREDLPKAPGSQPAPAPATEDREDRDSLADPWFH